MPGGEDHHGRVAVGGVRRDRAERGEQRVRIGLHRRDPVLGEHFREQAHHHLAVLQHVGDARRGAAVVFQHVEVVLADAHEIGARDMAVDVVRRTNGGHLHPVLRITEDEVGGNDAGLHAFLWPVDVLKEGVERPRPLNQALFQRAPFLAGDDARHDVEGDQPLMAFSLAIDGEGDADAAEEQLGLAAARVEELRRGGLDPLIERGVGPARRIAPRLAVHLVERLHALAAMRQSGHARAEPVNGAVSPVDGQWARRPKMRRRVRDGCPASRGRRSDLPSPARSARPAAWRCPARVRWGWWRKRSSSAGVQISPEARSARE